MPTTRDTGPHTSQELLDALATARGTARLQLHLFSLEARERWQELEERLDNLQRSIELDGERVSENLSKKARELTRSVKEFLLEHSGGSAKTGGVGRIMKAVKSCRPEDTLNEPARLMWDLDCGAVPVVNDAGKVVGMLTDRDICMAAYTRGEPLAALSVGSTMSTEVVTASPKDSIESVAELMSQRQVRRVPLVNDEGRLVGIVALADIARCAPVEGTDLANALRAISQPRPGSATVAAE